MYLHGRENIRRSNTTTSNDKIIIIAHALDGFDDFGFVVRNHFDTFEILRAYLTIVKPLTQ
jgi:hypothetical protein